jgi:hypothetical protein
VLFLLESLDLQEMQSQILSDLGAFAGIIGSSRNSKLNSNFGSGCCFCWNHWIFKKFKVKFLFQIWVLFLLESPYHTPSFSSVRNVFNWTATYRHDSTIVAPYERYIPLNDSMHTREPTRNYAQGKTKKVMSM